MSLLELPACVLRYIFTFFTLCEKGKIASVCKDFEELSNPSETKLLVIKPACRVGSTVATRVIAKCARLQTLELFDCVPRKRCWNAVNVAIFAINNCERLTTLSVSVDLVTVKRLLKCLEQFPRVRNLKISGSYDCLVFTNNARGLRHLEKLYLVAQTSAIVPVTYLSNPFLIGISNFLPLLKNLKLDDVVYDRGLTEILINVRATLEVLHVNDARLLTSIVYNELSLCVRLQTLSITNARLLDIISFRKILQIPALRHISINDAPLLTRLAYIWAFQDINYLESIILINCDNIDNVSIFFLASSARQLKNFVILAAPTNNILIDNLGMSELIHRCRTLQLIHLRNIPRVTPSFLCNANMVSNMTVILD